jgi:integrase
LEINQMRGAIGRLTAAKVRAARPKPGGKANLIADGGGLYLLARTGKGGQVNKSWIFRFTGCSTGKERQMGLGSLDAIGLADRPAINPDGTPMLREALNPDGTPMLDAAGKQVMLQVVLPGARTMAAQARSMLQVGQDPLDAKSARTASAVAARTHRLTFAEAAEQYLVKYEDGWKNKGHRQQWRDSLHKHILPTLGRLKVAKIETRHVLDVLEPIWSVMPETASRIRGRIEAVLDLATAQGARSGPNPAKWRGHLEHLLAGRNRAREVKHLEAMPYSEIAGFMSELRRIDGIAARALEFAILCATRTGETLGATWSEIDLEAALWCIPASRTKRDKAHVVPLSGPAVALLRQMEAIRSDDRVFPVGPEAMLRVLRPMRPTVTVHGFRSTFRSWAGACTLVSRDVCELALGHSVGSAVEQSYMRDSLLAKRRVLMDDWSRFLASEGAAVVSLRTSLPRPDENPSNSSTDERGQGIRQSWMWPGQVCTLLRVGRDEIDRMIDRGELPALDRGRLPTPAVDRLLEQRRSSATAREV